MYKQMGLVWLTIGVGVTSLVAGMPQGGQKTDERVGLERPSTSPAPEISECGIDDIISQTFGGGGNSNCNNNGPSEPPYSGGNVNGGDYNNQPPPPTGGDYNNPPPPTGGDYNNPPPPPNQNGECECVPFFLCDDKNNIIKDGEGLIDIRFKDECGSYEQRCCSKGGVTNVPLPVFNNTVTPTLAKCGIRNADGIGFRITGAYDNEAQYGEFPWMVAIVQPDASRSPDGKPVSVYQCGGSLIHPQVVLTGAHCVKGKNNLVIRAGEWDTQTKNELYPTQDRNVREVIVHEQFNNKNLINDPALLILETPVDITAENVGLVCLPEENENMDGRDCVASGWGKDQFGKEGKYQVILKKVELPIVPRAPCLEALRKTRLGAHFELHPSFICAGGIPGRDTCKGDGGSPMACPSRNNPDVYVQAGIVAWGINCSTETPGVYVNVPSFVSWINNHLQQRGISIHGSCGNCNINDNGGVHNLHQGNSNGGHTLAPNSNNGGYSMSAGINNGGGSRPLPNPNNNHGGSHNPPPKNNHGSGSYKPLAEINNGGGFNPPSQKNNNNGNYNPGNNFNAGDNNPPPINNNHDAGYKPHSQSNNNNNNNGGYNPGNNFNAGGDNPLPSNNGESYNPPPTNNNNGPGYKPHPQNNNNNNNGDYNPGNNINAGGDNPLPSNNNGGSYNPPPTNNNNSAGYKPHSQNNNGDYNPENNINAGGNNPLQNNNNGAGYKPPSQNNNNNNGDYNPGNNVITGSNNPPPKTNNGESYKPSPESNNNSNNNDCMCVPFYLCDDNNTIVEDGVGLLDIRVKDECGSYDQICCEETHVRGTDNPVITAKPSSHSTPVKKCGTRNTNGVGFRITGAEDSEAEYGEFPWMVAVIRTDFSRIQDGKPVNVYQCGGSLIHPQVVLTGAHCVKGKDNLLIRAGEWDTQSVNEIHPTQDIDVKEVIVHEQFNEKSLINDPALLILEKPVNLTQNNVGLICLPEENENMDGRDCVASGWGKDQFGSMGKYQVILKKVELPIVPRSTCVEALRKTRLGTHFKLHESLMCAGGKPGKDTCKGDGGSPLACPSKDNPDQYVQAGIVAWGIDCGTETPGVYVNVPYTVSWINNKLQQHGFTA